MAVAAKVPEKFHDGATGNVLIVDDNADFADSLADVLSWMATTFEPHRALNRRSLLARTEFRDLR